MNFVNNKEYTGSIKWFNDKGFGVIEPDDKKENDVFVHHSSIKTDTTFFKLLEIGEKVRYMVVMDKNRLSAVEVYPIEDQFNFEKGNFRKNKKPHGRFKKKNTVNFKPSHLPTDMRVLYQDGTKEFNKKLTSRDVVFVNNFFDDKNTYQNLLNELKNTGLSEKGLWKEWHGKSHLIADDHLDWKEKSPTFNMVINKIKNYFGMDIKATRLNHYRDSSEWKPFHHDAAAVKKDKAKTQNFTVGVSFGGERDVAFEHALTGTKVSLPLPNGSAYIFTKDVNIEWRHGILQAAKLNKNSGGRISIIVWGWKDQIEELDKSSEEESNVVTKSF